MRISVAPFRQSRPGHRADRQRVQALLTDKHYPWGVYASTGQAWLTLMNLFTPFRPRLWQTLYECRIATCTQGACTPLFVNKENYPMSLPQLLSGKLRAGLLTKSLWLPLSLIASILLLSTLRASAADPPGATPHSDGSTAFRVWAPFVDAVAVKINGGTAVPLAREDGHPDPADTTWAGKVPGAKAGDKYRYAIERGGVTREFNDPRAQQLTGFDLPNGFGLAGNDDEPQSVIVDPNFNMPAFTEPTFNTMVIYELHIGTFNNTFAGAIEKLDYLKDLGINAVEVLPITQNPLFSDHDPPDHDWGYDPVQLFAVKSKYGAPQEFKEFVKQCHQRQIAVIVDVVDNHLVGNNLLKEFGGFTLPEIPGGIYLYGGDRANTGFGPRPDYGRPQVRQYINDNALLLLRDYGVDGLRFDDTIDIRTFGRDRAANKD